MLNELIVNRVNKYKKILMNNLTEKLMILKTFWNFLLLKLLIIYINNLSNIIECQFESKN